MKKRLDSCFGITSLRRDSLQIQPHQNRHWIWNGHELALPHLPEFFPIRGGTCNGCGGYPQRVRGVLTQPPKWGRKMLIFCSSECIFEVLLFCLPGWVLGRFLKCPQRLLGIPAAGPEGTRSVFGGTSSRSGGYPLRIRRVN